MAALNTLRTKGSILLTVVIGISLLAFLLGDGASLFNSGTATVGTVNGQEVSLKAYGTEVNSLTNIRQSMSGQSSLTAEELETVQNQVWNKFVTDIALVPVYNDLGLTVSNEELLDMVAGKYISPIAMQLFTNPTTGSYDAARATEYISNLDVIDAQGGARQMWTYFENQMNDNRLNQKYNDLVRQGMYVTDMQVAQSVLCNNDNYNIEYVAKSLNSINDTDIKVTDQDLKDYYNKHLKRFEFQDSREVEYVTFEIAPSAEDYKEAQDNAARVTTELREATDIEQYVNYTSEKRFDGRYSKASELPSNLQEVIASSQLGATFEPVLENNVYSISRLVDVKNMADSLTLRSVYVDPSKNIDSIINVIKGGGFVSVVNTLSLTNDPQASEAVTVSTSDLQSLFASKLINANRGEVVSFDVQGAKQLVYVERVSAPVRKYQIAEVIMTVTPSPKTEQDIYAKATAFQNAANDAKSFDAAIDANQYIKRQATIYPSDRNLGGIDNSRELVRWSYTAKEGAVSNIVTAGNVNIVACLKTTREKGIAPFDQVKEQIRPLCIAKLKMDAAVKDISGATSLEALSAKVGSDVQIATDINFSMMSIPGLGATPEAIGAITTLKEGTVSKGIPAGNSAIAIVVTSKMKNDAIDSAKMRALLESMTASYLDMRIGSALAQETEIKDNRVIYY